MFGAKINNLWEGQLLDPSIHYIREGQYFVQIVEVSEFCDQNGDMVICFMNMKHR